MACYCHKITEAITAVGKLPLFQNLSADEIAEIEPVFEIQTFNLNQTIIEHNRQGSDVYFVLSGNAHILSYSETGRMISFGCLGAGDYFGEISAIDGGPRSAWVVAKKETKVAILPQQKFLAVTSRHSSVAMQVMQRLASYVRSGNVRILDLTMLGSTQRICLEILKLLEPNPANIEEWYIHPMPTQEAIASSTGVSRETVARILTRLKKEGIVERVSRTLLVMKRDELEKMAI